mgnify:CR=1 FL=1
MSKTKETCKVFYLCDNPATTTYNAGPVGVVPSCKRCADKMNRIENMPNLVKPSTTK